MKLILGDPILQKQMVMELEVDFWKARGYDVVIIDLEGEEDSDR